MKERIQELLEAIALTFVDNIKQQLIAFDLKDSNIIKQVGYKIENSVIVISIPEYAKYIEDGRRPGKWVPIKPLIEWMIRKRIAPGRETSVAYAISAAIKRRGIKPRPFLSKAYKESEKEVNELLALDLTSIINDEIKKILKING